VALWSAAGVATGYTRGLPGLVGCRAVLGAAEAAGIPAAGKAIHEFLRPAERALGNALNQAGVSLGLMLAPPVATWLAVRHGWRAAFVVTGLLGLLWIPVWNIMARGRGAAPTAPAAQSGAAILRDRRLWGLVAANALNMTGYSLWTNWTTLYLVEVHRLTLVQAAWYAWIPPLFATVGGFAGGWLSLRWVRRGAAAPAARTRACGAAAALALASALVPLAPTAAWASAAISLAILAVAAFSVNTYTMPLDIFGGPHAAFAVSLLVSSYGVVQAIVSPAIGAGIDAAGYAPVCVAVAALPLAAWRVLVWSGSSNS
jgi:ACS family hexuronate transporter-like MFS transporter